MQSKMSLLGGAAVGVLIALTFGAGADAKTTKKHVHHEAHETNADLSAQRMNAMSAEIEALKARLDAEERDSAQAKAQAAQAQADAQSMRGELAQQIQTIPGAVKSEIASERPKDGKIHYKGITLTVGGFAAAETVSRKHDETADIGSSYAKIPYANDRAGQTSSTNFTGRQSRYSLLAEGDVNDSTKASFYGEFDFLGAAQTANSNESNSYQPRVRNLYAAVDWTNGWHLLAGQNWSLATMNSNGISQRNEVTPTTIDAQYVPGFVWTRQPQIRVTKDFNKELWLAVSLENPQTTFSASTLATASGITLTNFQAPTSQYYSGTNYSLNNIPDVIGKVAVEENLQGHKLHAEVFGIYRSYMSRVTSTGTGGAALLGVAAGNNTDVTSGGGFGAGLTFQVVPKMLDVQLSGLTGRGIGRYGSAQLPDVTASPDGRLQAIQETMWLAGLTFHATPQLDIYAYGGEEFEQGKTFLTPGASSVGFGYGTLTGSNNSGCVVEGGSCSALTKSVGQLTIGGWDKVYTGSFGRVQIGLQYSYTEKKAFADATAAGLAPKATENMIFTSFRYYPF